MTTVSKILYGSGYRYDNPGSSPSSTVYVYAARNQSRTGVPNPQWRQQIRNGANASTPFTGSKSGIDVEDGTYRVSYYYPSVLSPARVVRTAVSSGQMFPALYTPPYGALSFVEANNQALIRTYKAIRDAQYQISGPTFLGELRETLSMLRRPANALREYSSDYLRALKSRKARRPKRLDSVLADTWLEYSFGWSPLLSDVKAAAETIARFANDAKTRRTQVSGFGEVPTLIYDIADPTVVSTNAGVKYKVHIKLMDVAQVKYRVGINASLAYPEGSVRRLIQLSGFQMQNWIPTAWELLPWSFMVDYFSNIGDVIEAACTDTSSVTRVTKNEIGESRFSRYYLPDGAATALNFGQNYISQGGSLGGYKSFNRRVNRVASSLGFPTLRFELPARQGQLGNIAALALSQQRLIPYR